MYETKNQRIFFEELIMAAAENLESFRALNRGSEKSFCIIFSFVFTVYGCWPLFQHETVRWWAIFIGFLLLAFYFFVPQIVKPFNNAWMAFGSMLGKIFTPIIIMAIYFIVFCPIGMLLIFFRFLRSFLKKEAPKNSYWIERNKEEDSRESFNRQF